ncbi:MAG: OsmC family peroxiredoxin [Bacteroidetes bacterium]|nr:MAG: OsmC family peroxiredoxin [Bacteroidota bacterium]
MQVTLKRTDDAFHMEAVNETGNTVEIDGNPEIGGGNKAFRPMQLMLVGLGGCSSIDVIHLLKKQRQNLEDIRVEVRADRDPDAVPSLFTKIYIHFFLKGDLDPKKVERACSLSMEKYCSVAKILEKTAPIEWTYTIEPGE